MNLTVVLASLVIILISIGISGLLVQVRPSSSLRRKVTDGIVDTLVYPDPTEPPFPATIKAGTLLYAEGALPVYGDGYNYYHVSDDEYHYRYYIDSTTLGDFLKVWQTNDNTKYIPGLYEISSGGLRSTGVYALDAKSYTSNGKRNVITQDGNQFSVSDSSCLCVCGDAYASAKDGIICIGQWKGVRQRFIQSSPNNQPNSKYIYSKGIHARHVFGMQESPFLTAKTLNNPEPVLSAYIVDAFRLCANAATYRFSPADDWNVAPLLNFGLVTDRFGKLYTLGDVNKPSQGEGFYGPIQPALSGIQIASVAAGSGSWVAVSTNGSVYGKGINKNGELGLGHANPVSEIQQVPISLHEADRNAMPLYASMWERTCILTNTGSVYASGVTPQSANASHVFEKISLSRFIVQVSQGFDHTAFLTRDRHVIIQGFVEEVAAFPLENGEGNYFVSRLNCKNTATSLNYSHRPCSIASGYRCLYILNDDGSVCHTGTSLAGASNSQGILTVNFPGTSFKYVTDETGSAKDTVDLIDSDTLKTLATESHGSYQPLVSIFLPHGSAKQITVSRASPPQLSDSLEYTVGVNLGYTVPYGTASLSTSFMPTMFIGLQYTVTIEDSEQTFHIVAPYFSSGTSSTYNGTYLLKLKTPTPTGLQRMLNGDGIELQSFFYRATITRKEFMDRLNSQIQKMCQPAYVTESLQHEDSQLLQYEAGESPSGAPLIILPSIPPALLEEANFNVDLEHNRVFVKLNIAGGIISNAYRQGVKVSDLQNLKTDLRLMNTAEISDRIKSLYYTSVPNLPETLPIISVIDVFNSEGDGSLANTQNLPLSYDETKVGFSIENYPYFQRCAHAVSWSGPEAS